jgi:hypothetical protein
MIKRKRGRPPTKKTGTLINNDPFKVITSSIEVRRTKLN